MSVTRWILAECEQSPTTGNWHMSPSTVLPAGTFIRLFRSDSDPQWALARVTATSSAVLDTIESALTSTGKVNRLRRGQRLGPLVNNARFRAYLTGLGVDPAQFSTNSNADDIIAAVLAVHDPDGSRRGSYVTGEPAVEE